ncbi:plasmid stabilization system protein ParE [Pseudorhizobium tarimense]|uniref:Plasmid stabilization system protein ParE n=1 Tax=Pseudorhizobium tarimense TaxID=1079109 RepID=A0ABV2H6P5_9HYPH|nr:hypothetical protein [Pseudorhizobium tarimense]MCJ8519444.1 hypothetical protein [Pseudorhizobium tarimense]
MIAEVARNGEAVARNGEAAIDDGDFTLISGKDGSQELLERLNERFSRKQQTSQAMADYRLSAFALEQIGEILERSQEKFGDIARERCAALLVTAMQDAADDPRRPTVSWRSIPCGKVGIYHIRNSESVCPILSVQSESHATISSSNWVRTTSLIYWALSMTACCSAAHSGG